MNAGRPHSRSKVWKAPDREIGKPGENRGKVIEHRDFQPTAESRQRLLGGPAAEPEAGQGRKITPAKAKEYVFAAKGDKDKAREAASKDGWTF